MQTVKVFKLGKAQAVRIPVRYQFSAEEVTIEQDGDTLVLRPKYQTAGELFTAIRARGSDWSDWKRPEQGTPEPIEPLGD